MSRPPAADSSALALSCDMVSGYRGLVLRQPVYARLVRDGGRLYGRYFYEKVGVDIALDGSASADLSIALTEGRSDAPTGRFEGVCDPRSGTIRGKWSGMHATGPFSFEPIAIELTGGLPRGALRKLVKELTAAKKK